MRRALMIGLLLLSAGKATAQTKHCRIVNTSRDWFDKAVAVTDRKTLAKRYRRMRYNSPERALLMAARIVRGVGQPAFLYYSLGDSGFDTRFWPASTVKIVAAVGALMTLRREGLDGTATLRFADSFGRFRGRIARLYRPALIWSSNRAYDRLLLVAGVDTLNGYLNGRFGVPSMVVQFGYAGADTTRSPEIHYQQGDLRGTIAKRVSTRSYPSCGAGNCATLFELQEVLRRVVLHEQLPASERFPLADRDVRGLRRALAAAPSKIDRGATKGLGHRVRIYNKAGRYPGRDHLDNTLVIDKRTGQRYMVALSVPYTRRYRTDSATARQLDELGRNTLLALRKAKRGAPLQLDAGNPISVSTTWSAQTQRCRVRIEVSSAERVRAWVGNKRLAVSRTTKGYEGQLATAPGTSRALLVVQAISDGRPVGYRSVWIGR